MKKKNLIFSAVGVGLLAAVVVGGFVHFQRQHTDRFLKVGIAVYDLDDPYIQTLTDAIRSQLKGKNIDGKEIIYDVFDASGSAVTQNTQLYGRGKTCIVTECLQSLGHNKWGRYAALNNAGYDAAKAVYPEAQCITTSLHRPTERSATNYDLS